MHIRPKTKRRLLILLTIMALSVGVLLAVFAFSRHRNAIALRALRERGMTAYRGQNFEDAVTLLGDYVDRAADADPDAQFAYGKSRVNVAMPGGKNLFEGIRIFRQYLDSVRPGDVPAEHELLRLYVQTGSNVDAEHLADEILAKNAADGQAMWQKVWALVGEHRFDQALQVCEKLNGVEPLNLSAQRETLYLMGQNKASPQMQLDHATALYKAHEQDPRFEVLMADACAGAHEDDERKKWLKTAASRTPPDAAFVLAMASALDSAEMFDDADAFITRAADAIPDTSVQRLYAQRLWQDGKASVLEERLKNQEPADRASDGRLIGYRALALFEDAKTSQARTLVAALAKRSDGPGSAWAIALADKFSPGSGDAAQHIVDFRQAVSRDPQNPVLHLILAEGLLQSGEAELAITQCEQGYQLARSWALPHIIAVQALLAGGRNGDAVATAREAWKRAPGHYDTETTLARADFALACESGMAGDFAALLPRLELIQNSWHDPQMLGIYVTALARAGKTDEATAVVKAAISSDKPLPAQVLVNLAQVAEAERLDIGEQVLDLAQRLHGLSPEIAYARARSLLGHGKTSEGDALLRQASTGHEGDLAWRIVLADYHEMAGLPDPLKDWIALGNQYSGDLRVQQTILHAQSRTRDRAFWELTIERLKKLTGEQALYWRLERGRWLLAGGPSDQNTAEAVNLLEQVTQSAPSLAEPRRLLATAMVRAKNNDGAIAELTAAADANSGDPLITRSLVELLLANNRARDATAYLDKLAQRSRLAPDVQQWIAEAYIQLGANEKAAAILSAAEATAGDSIPRVLTLARLDARLGRDEQAARLYQSLVEKEINSADACVEAADFFASRGSMKTADQFMAKLAALQLDPGTAELDAAEFADRWITADDASKRFDVAIAAAPKSAEVWTRLTAFDLRHQRFADAATASEKGLIAHPDDAALKTLRDTSAALAALPAGQDWQALEEAVISDPKDAGVNEMIALLGAVAREKLSPAAVAVRVRAVADHHRQNIYLQSQAVRSLLSAGQTAAALEVAQAMAGAFSTSAEPQRLLADIFASTNQWAKAERAALLWRQHANGRTLGPDLALGEIYLRQPNRDSAGAIRVLTPHISADAPQRNPAATELYARALIAGGRANEAADMLRPLLGDSARWRAAWLSLVSVQKDYAAAADWIGRVAPMIAPDAVDENIALADAWWTAGQTFASADAFDHAQHIVAPLQAAAKDDARVWMLSAEIAHATKDYSDAEKFYREAIRLDPTSLSAMNNLAYVLWISGDDQKLAEAMKLSQAAVAGQPNNASFYDTLARIQARSGDHASAIATFRTALDNDATSVEAMIGLADLLAQDAATRPQARELLNQIARLMSGSSRLSDVLQKQYQTARDAVASTL